jgi:hypothetical protein
VSQNELFVARRLDRLVRFTRNLIVVVDPETGRIKRSFRVPLPGYVSHMQYLRGSLFVAGSFRRFRANGQPAHLAILELDPRTGELNDVFDPHAHGPVYELAPSNELLYIAGLFDEVQDVERRGLAAIYRKLGLLRYEFEPPANVVGDNTTSLTALGRDVLFEKNRRLFLAAGSGAIDREAAEGYARSVDAAVGVPGGIVYAASLTMPLHGFSQDGLSFVATAER